MHIDIHMGIHMDMDVGVDVARAWAEEAGREAEGVAAFRIFRESAAHRAIGELMGAEYENRNTRCQGKSEGWGEIFSARSARGSGAGRGSPRCPGGQNRGSGASDLSTLGATFCSCRAEGCSCALTK